MNYESLLHRALELYGIQALDTQLLHHSDKRVYKICTESGDYVLFMYTPATGSAFDARNEPYNRPEALFAETNVLERLAKELPELGTQRILRTKNGDVLAYVDDIPVRVTNYIQGAPLSEREGGPLFLKQAYMAGVACAKLHDFAEKAGLEICQGRPDHRQAYFREMLASLRRHHDAHHMTDAQFDAIERGGRVILDCMDALTAENRIGFVHTDLRSANLIDDGSRAVPIDFSRSTLGFPLFDLGEMCMHMGGAPIQRQILAGYDSLRPLDEFSLHCIEAFAVMFILFVCNDFLCNSGHEDWLEVNLPRIEQYFVPNLMEGTLIPRDFR